MTEPEKTGFLKRSKNFAQEKYAESKAKREAAVEAERKFYEEATAKYGRLAASELFDGRRIELYDGGYVRVGGECNTKGPASQSELIFVVAYDTPFEKLRAIKASTQVQDKSTGGRAVASAASFGLSKLASNENRYVFLTISTDVQTHSLKATGGMSRATDEAAMKLELAGHGILDGLGSRAPLAPSTPAPGSVADQLRDLAALHHDGVLSDEEFATAKAKVLGS